EPGAVPLLEVADDLAPHARLPVALQVVGDVARGGLGRGANEEVADLVGHLDEQVDVHSSLGSLSLTRRYGARWRTPRAGRRARRRPASVRWCAPCAPRRRSAPTAPPAASPRRWRTSAPSHSSRGW